MQKKKAVVKKSTNKKIKLSDYGIIGLIKENRGAHLLLSNIGSTIKIPSESDFHAYSHIYGYRTFKLSSILEFYVDLYEHLDISVQKTKKLRIDLFVITHSKLNSDKLNFQKNLKHLLELVEKTDTEIYPKLCLLNPLECLRLEESMNCLQQGSNLASVVMAVSAVEYRLHKLIMQKNKSLYKKTFEAKTLGGLIQLFQPGAYKGKTYANLKNILPEKHKPLMEMLNTYRIFSAHPKDERITPQMAKAILSLSFLLLVDEKLKT